MKEKSSAICRIDTEHAWHSYSKDHLGLQGGHAKACNRQSPFSISLSEKKIKFAQPKYSEDDQTLSKKVLPITTSVVSF